MVTEDKIIAKPTSDRFKEADWFKPNVNVVIGGVGGIGSWLSLFLARQEANLFIYDFDQIEEHNMGGQLYKTSNIGRNKTDAIIELARDYANSMQVQAMGKFEKNSPIDKIVFSCFDNMAARKLMFEQWKNLPIREIFIDGRMLAEQAQIFVVLPGREKQYEETLFEDSEVEDQPCSYKATSHCGAMIAAYMVSVFNNYMSNVKNDADLRSIPFKIAYELPLLTFEALDYEATRI